MNEEVKKIHVLIVEDSKTQAEWLKVTLEEVGMHAEYVDTLAGCIHLIRRESFDAIMLDLTLPDSSGIATLSAVQASAPWMPVIVLTAIEEDFGMEALKAGAEDYLCKGETTPGALVRSIRYAIERKSQAKALRQIQRQTRDIIERAQDAFLAVNLDGTIVDWNRKAQELFGWSRMEALGEQIVELLVATENHDQFKTDLKTFCDTGGGALIADKIELEVRHKHGGTLPIEVAFFPVQLAEGPLLCAFACDITNRKEVTQRMNEFYATVSHELRSPITSIRGSMRLLENGFMGELGTDVLEMLTISIGSCDRMLRLISDLLDMSKIEAGKMEYAFEVVEAARLVNTTLEGIKGMAAEARVELRSDVDRLEVLGDSDKILQVLTNLISNAIKFSPENSEIKVKVASGAVGRVRFSITDQGPGIPEKDMHKIFGKFQQLENASTISAKGTGLGLAISKAIVVQHNGDIGVDSQEGKGTTFWFEVPSNN